MTWWQGLVGLLGVTLVPALTYLASRTASKSSARSAHTADWSAFMAEQREWVEDMLAERDKRIDRLEKRLDVIEQKYRQAVAYIRRLVTQLRMHVDPDQIEKPPEEIIPDL